MWVVLVELTSQKPTFFFLQCHVCGCKRRNQSENHALADCSGRCGDGEFSYFYIFYIMKWMFPNLFSRGWRRHYRGSMSKWILSQPHISNYWPRQPHHSPGLLRREPQEPGAPRVKFVFCFPVCVELWPGTGTERTGDWTSATLWAS